jgi:hypothetical protein
LKKVSAIPIVFLLLCSCIGWNSDQKEVVTSYNALLENAEKENWQGMFGCLTEETQELLNEVAEVYTGAGIPFENKGEELLAALVTDTGLLFFSNTIVSIEIRNGNACLVSGEGTETASYTFVREDRQWKLDLVPMLTEFLAEAMAGTSGTVTEPSTFSAPSTISAGSGACELTIVNDLENLSVWNAYCSPGNSDSWGEDWLGTSILEAGSELKILLDEGVYDIQLVDSEGSAYTAWQINLGTEGVVLQISGMNRDDSN